MVRPNAGCFRMRRVGDDRRYRENEQNNRRGPGATGGEQQRHGDDGGELADGTVNEDRFADHGAHDSGFHEDGQEGA